MTEHHLGTDHLHFVWDNRLPPVLRIAPGDTVTFETWEASGHDVRRTSTARDVERPRNPPRGHALTGPVAVDGAHSGQTLVVDVLEVAPGAWGYTMFSPGRGLLPDDFPHSHIRIWDLSDGDVARGIEDVKIPLAPFCGVMGVALAEAGLHATAPPRRVGGNMDVRQLTAGSTLYLPIEVESALFSVGDAHGAQGDGEVCITAIEMDSTTRLRFSLGDTPVREPQLRLERPPTTIAGPYHGCTAHAPDLLEAARNATRYLIEWLARELRIGADDAYLLSSVAGELRISQVVDAPNWTVTAFFPLAVLG
jgi:acetamidase/formamidase